MTNYLADFCRRISFEDDVAFYYTGHGLYYKDTTFLVPIDAPATITTSTIEEHCVSLAKIQVDLGTKRARLKLFMIDSCQEELPEPFQNSMGQGQSSEQEEMGRRKSTKTKLKELKTSDRGLEFITILATPPGTSAIETRTGTFFTDSFIKAVADPKLKLVDLKSEITEHIKTRERGNTSDSGNRQLPVYGFHSLGREMGRWPLTPSLTQNQS